MDVPTVSQIIRMAQKTWSDINNKNRLNIQTSRQILLFTCYQADVTQKYEFFISWKYRRSNETLCNIKPGTLITMKRV